MRARPRWEQPEPAQLLRGAQLCSATTTEVEKSQLVRQDHAHQPSESEATSRPESAPALAAGGSQAFACELIEGKGLHLLAEGYQLFFFFFSFWPNL